MHLLEGQLQVAHRHSLHKAHLVRQSLRTKRARKLTDLIVSSTSPPATLSPAPASPNTSSSPTNTPDASSSGSGASTNIGAIVGGVVGGLAVIGIVVVAMYWIRRRHPKQKTAETYNEEAKIKEPPDWREGATLAELEQGNVRPTPELDARWNQINEMPAIKK